jgi:MFS family permease
MSVALTFFALFGTLFALTQYLQLVHGYSPLAAGVRALPFAVAMGALSPLSAVAARRLGVRTVVPTGLALMGVGVGLLSFLHPATPYLDVVGAVVIMGAGMGLVMAPASEVIMTSVPQDRAGLASAVNDTVREVGGSLGVAVIGSLVSAGFRAHVTTTGLAPTAAHTARSSVAAADAVAAQAGSQGAALISSAHSAYTIGLSHGFKVAAAVALVGAVGAALLIPRREAKAAEAVAEEPTMPACLECALA